MPYFSKKSLGIIVWSTSTEYRERKLHLTGFINTEVMENGEDIPIPMFNLGLGFSGRFESPPNFPCASVKGTLRN